MRTPPTFGLVLVLLLCTVSPVLAYGGPGSVISGIGAFLAALGAILAALLGFVWYPLKRLYHHFFSEEADKTVAEAPGE